MSQGQITLRQLRCLSALAQARSFRGAAAMLGVSQPALSAQIRALEAALGLALVERRANGAGLTPIGRDALAHAQTALDAAHAVERFALGARRSLTGRLRLGVSPTVGPYLLPHVVGRLHQDRPELRLLVREGAPTELSRQLLEGAHDAILAQLPLRDDGLSVTELFREDLRVIVAADHPLARQRVVWAQQLAGLHILTLDARFQLRAQVEALCAACGAELAQDYEGSSLDALRLMTAMNAGVAIVPELYAISEVGQNADVVALPLKGRALQRRIGLAWRRSLTDATSLRLIGDIARAAFAELTGRGSR